MTHRAVLFLAFALGSAASACSSDDSNDSGAGGTSASGGTAGSGGATGGTAGTGTTGGTSGGAGGSLSAGGSAGSGGASGGSGGTAGVGGASGGSAGSAGAAAGGGAGGAAGGAGGAGGSGGSSSTAVPSEGCGQGGRPSGGVVTVDNHHIYTFPESYDGNVPFPLLMGFHAAGNPINQIQNLTNGSDFEDEYVRAFPKSAGSEWVYNTDIQKVRDVYDELLENYCIDTSRIFATGHSSGAQLIVQILNQSHTSDAQHFGFKAVAPVAASNYGALSGPMPVMYIQGKQDNVRNSDGADVVARFTTANGCENATQPYEGAPSCMSSGKTVNDGCVRYQGCDEPTVWCSHDDPQYSNTNHGWPCFATQAMYDFFTGLP